MWAKRRKAGAIMTRADKLSVSVYALHGDTCGLQDSYNHHDSLGCASGFASGDYVLVARFAYLQEAIDYCQLISKRGVNTRLVSRIVPTAPYVSNYPKQAEAQS
jgi:hypothetical protein